MKKKYYTLKELREIQKKRVKDWRVNNKDKVKKYNRKYYLSRKSSIDNI